MSPDRAMGYANMHALRFLSSRRWRCGVPGVAVRGKRPYWYAVTITWNHSPGNLPMPYPADVVLFDLDGTLIDTIPDLADALDWMLARMDRPAAGPDKVRIWIGNGMDKLLQRALRDADGADPSAALMDRARELFRERYGRHFCERSCLYEGTEACLAALSAAGIGLGIVTNKPTQFTEPLLETLGIRGYFGAVLGGDALPERKPDPTPLFEAVRRIDPEASRVVMVGDSVNDIEAARRAGYPVICLTYGYNHGQDIRDGRPDAVIDSLRELPALIEGVSGS